MSVCLFNKQHITRRGVANSDQFNTFSDNISKNVKCKIKFNIDTFFFIKQLPICVKLLTKLMATFNVKKILYDVLLAMNQFLKLYYLRKT